MIKTGRVTLEQFGAVGDGRDSSQAFSEFKAWFLSERESDASRWITLELEHGALYCATDVHYFLGLDRLLVKGNGARLQNLGPVKWLAWMLGGMGYIGASNQAWGTVFNADKSYLLDTVEQGSQAVVAVSPNYAGEFSPGDWVIISSGVRYFPSSPPSPQRFDYVKVVVVDVETGEISIDRPVKSRHSATLPSHPKNETHFDGRARIFRLDSGWNVEQRFENLHILPPSDTEQEAYVLACGRRVDFIGGSAPWIAPSNIMAGSAVGCSFPGAAAGAHNEIDKLVGQFAYRDCDIGCYVGGICPGGVVSFDNCRLMGGFGGVESFHARNSEFTSIELRAYAQRVAFDFCSNSGVFGSDGADPSNVVCVIDGSVSYDANGGEGVGRITIPKSAYEGDPILSQFVCSIYEGGILDVVELPHYRLTGVSSIIKTLSGDDDNIYVDVVSNASIEVGVMLRATRMQSFHGNANTGNLPNGDIESLRSNRRRFNIAPISGDVVNVGAQFCAGLVKEILIDVRKPASTESGCYVVVYNLHPVANAFTAVINAKVAGCRRITRHSAIGAQSGDELNAAGDVYLSSYFIHVGTSPESGPVTLLDQAAALPVITVEMHLEDAFRMSL